jgi:hypothetical protein
MISLGWLVTTAEANIRAVIIVLAGIKVVCGTVKKWL